MGTQPSLKNGHGAKNMKWNSSHHHVSPTSIGDLIQVKVFSVKHLVKMLAIFSVDGQYCKAIT